VKSENILAYPPRVLTQAERMFYFEQGYVRRERLIPDDLVRKLQAATSEVVERSRSLAASTDEFVLEPGHGPQAPRPRRLNRATDQHPVFWELAAHSALPDMVSDLVGPDVKFREAYINFKWAKGGDEVKWHQDFPFNPHINKAMLATLTFIEDVEPDQGPLMVIPRSHEGPLYDHYDASGRWAASMSAADVATLPLDSAVSLTGPAGTVVAIHCAMVHGSARNDSARSRPLLITGYSSADNFAYTPMGPNMTPTQAFQIVRGKPAGHAHHEAMRTRVPPDWSGGYASIFEDQQGRTLPRQQ